MIKRLEVRTGSRTEFVDITSQVRQAVRASGAKSGICVVYCPHTTGAITVNENADPDVTRDLAIAFGRIAPHKGDYRHSEGNSDSHILSSLVGASETLIINDGDLLLGTWQGIYFCEFDGPRNRTFYVKISRDNVE